MTDCDSRQQRAGARTEDALTSSRLADVLTELDSKDLETSIAARELLARSLQSTRESWLLNGLWEHCMRSCSDLSCNLLASTPDMHSGRLFEKLNDGLVKQKTRLASLTVLEYVIRQQPTWLYKISQTNLFTNIIRCLKTDDNIPNLMNGLVVITTILPSIPVSVGPFLRELFVVFMRLMMICWTGYLGNVPEVLIVHLRVGVHALFCRLYAMYPKNFLNYLQDQYMSRHAHMVETQEAIQSFLETVRLHPHVVFGNLQWETSTSKWRGIDAQAIETECSKLLVSDSRGSYAHTVLNRTNETSVKSSCEKLHCFVIPEKALPPQLLLKEASNRREETHKFTCSESDSGVATDADHQSSVSTAELSMQFVSPSIALGLATPPPSRSISPSGSSHEVSSLMAARYGNDFSHRSTPTTTPGTRTPRTQLDSESLSSSTSGPTPLSGAASSAVQSRRGSATSSGRQSPSKGGYSPSLRHKQVLSSKHNTVEQVLSSTCQEEEQFAKGISSGSLPKEEVDVDITSSSPKVVLHPDWNDGTVVYDAVTGSNDLGLTERAITDVAASKVTEHDADMVVSTGVPHTDVTEVSVTRSTGVSSFTDLSVSEDVLVARDRSVSADLAAPRGGRKTLSSTVPVSSSFKPLQESSSILHRSRHLSLSGWMDGISDLDHHSYHSSIRAKLLAQSRRQGAPFAVPTVSRHPRSVSLDFIHALPAFTPSPNKHRSSDDLSNMSEPHSLPHDFVARPAHMWKKTEGKESRSVESLPEMTMLRRHQALFSPAAPHPSFKFKERASSDEGRIFKSSAELEVGQGVHTSELVTNVFFLDESVETLHVCGHDSSVQEDQLGEATDELADDGNYQRTGDDDTVENTLKQSISFNDFSNLRTVRTFSRLLPSVLPVPADLSHEVLGSEQRMIAQGGESGATVGHAQLAPAEILDRLLELGSALHAKRSSSIPMTYLEGTDWSHFGESPQADEVAILKSQVLLLHAQLMYERHHGQQHARRNRSLLSRAFQAEKLEEQSWALQHQLQMRQEDMEKIRVQAAFERDHERVKLDNSKKLEEALQRELTMIAEEKQVLRETEASAVEKAKTMEAEVDRLNDVVKKLNGKIFNLESNLADLSPKAAAAEQLQQQVDGLSHEVLLFEEMLDGYKQAEQQHEMILVRLAESERTLSAARYELKQSQDQLRYHTAQTMMLNAKVTEQETTVSNMTQAAKQHKTMIKNVKERCQHQLQAVDDTCSALKVANQRLEAHIMELYGRLEYSSSGHHIHVPGTASESSSLGSTPGTGVLPTLFPRSPDSFSALQPP